MNPKFIIYSVGKLLEILALVLLVPAAIALFEVRPIELPGVLLDHRLLGFVIAIAASLLLGNLLKLIGNREIVGNGIRDGFAIVTFGWIILTLLGSVPLFV